MTKAFVDTLISDMKKGDMVTNVSPWVFEGIAEKKMSVRYVGLKLDSEWQEVFEVGNNILLKFLYDRNSAFVEFYLANRAPFVKIITRSFTEGDKWENILGEVKRRLKKDKQDVVNHTEHVGNIYARLKPHLKV